MAGKWIGPIKSEEELRKNYELVSAGLQITLCPKCGAKLIWNFWDEFKEKDCPGIELEGENEYVCTMCQKEFYGGEIF